MATHTVHIFDALPRDKTILRETEDEIEIAYESYDEDTFRGGEAQGKRSLVINLFGTTADGTGVTIQVNGFKPFFYVELPPNGTLRSLQTAVEKANKKKVAVTYELVKKQKLFGFTGGRVFPFAKLSVDSMSNFYDLRKLFLDENQRPRLVIGKGEAPVRVYEASLDPMLRFFHIQNLQPCGWVTVRNAKEEEQEGGGLLLEAEWKDIVPATEAGLPASAPFLHGFWDIECYSHDKEFPVAKQGYRRVAKQLWTLKSWNEIPEKLVEAFAGSSDTVKLPPLKNPSLTPKPATIQKLVENESFLETLQTLWEGREGLLVKAREERFQKLIALLDKTFNKLAPIAGDPIIQIGTVMVRGQETPEKHIFVLGDCEKIPEAIVHTCKTEEELLLNWFQWLADNNFDILAGYNIFGFDEKYVWERLEELGLEQEECVQRLGRLFYDGGSVKLQEKFLSSSALGDNMLYLWNTPGRLRIDLYGHIKRKVQLNSYKLDAVAAAFLSGKLSGVAPAESPGRWLLKTKQTGDAHIGRYVQLLDELGEELTEKMAIVEVAAGGIVVESEEDLEVVAGEAVKWAVVKDDVSPQELFRLHREGGAAGRARIANYCIQDCYLVYELYKKLEVFNEAMSMANVCSVPVGYIFTRGQGVKIESLIFKDCMLKEQLIEVQAQYRYGKKSEYDLGHHMSILDKMEAAGHTSSTNWKTRLDYEKQKNLVDWLLDDSTNEDSYEGAIVLDPIPGFYTEAPIGVCDFASLYPSTIISENISHDMLVWTKDYDLTGKFVALRYGAVEDEANAPPGTHFTDIEFDILKPDPAEAHKKHPKKIKTGTRLCRFAQLADSQKGSLPQIVAKLLAARKAKRAEIGKTDDPFKKALLDAEQNAYKITANSLYGQLGSKTFKIRLQDLAASVTAYARKQIMFSKVAIEKFYGPSAGDPRCAAGEAQVVYGDSVTGDTALYIRKGGVPQVCRIDSLSTSGWQPWHTTKEAIELEGVEIWTERGWTAIRRLIRHRLAPTKKLFRILTHTGVVDCTDDHSLVAPDGKEIKPGDVGVGSQLLHNDAIGKEFGGAGDETPTVKEAWAMGFFLADGSCGAYEGEGTIKYSWAINKSDTTLLEKAAKALPFETKILDTLENSGVYKLVPVGNIKEPVLKYRELFYNAHREKRIPPCILNAPIEVIEQFMAGFYAGDGDKANGHGYIRWDQKGKEVCSGLYILSRRLGYTVSINDRAGKQDVFRLTLTENTQRKNPAAIKKIYEIPAQEYVYDLETENHHFAVGPGALVVHNTDSLFVCFNPKNPETGERLEGREAVVKTIELTEEAGHFITAALKAPHDFEYDKVFYPFIIFSKKRYVGNKYEESPDEFKQTSMGIALKRRDNTALLKMAYGGAIDQLLNKRDVAGAVECVKGVVRDLTEDKMKLSQLITTRSLAADYAGTPPAHKVLADRITARDPGNAPSSGDRIAFVYVKPPTGQEASKLQGDRVETPEFILEKGLKPDAEYYIEHQLRNPLAQLFGLLLEKIPGFQAPKAWSKDPEKLLKQRELLAAELLFKEGYAKCRASATRAFIEKIGGSVAASAAAKPRAPTAASVPLVLKDVAPKKQSLLTGFLRDTAVITDELAARAMGKAKAEKRKAEKKQDKKNAGANTP